MANPPRIETNDTSWRILVWGGLCALLMVPLVAMQFTDEVAWTGFDFAVAAGLLAIVGSGFELAVRLSPDWTYRAGFAVAVVAGFLTVWVNLAVGMIGNEENPANLLFLGVLLVAAAGAILARFQAEGMALALVATAIAQAGCAVWAASTGHVRDAVFVSIFCALWLTAAGLFRLAARAISQDDGSNSPANPR